MPQLAVLARTRGRERKIVVTGLEAGRRRQLLVAYGHNGGGELQAVGGSVFAEKTLRRHDLGHPPREELRERPPLGGVEAPGGVGRGEDGVDVSRLELGVVDRALHGGHQGILIIAPVGDRGARIAGDAESGEVAPYFRTEAEREDGTPLAGEQAVAAAIERPHALLRLPRGLRARADAI